MAGLNVRTAVCSLLVALWMQGAVGLGPPMRHARVMRRGRQADTASRIKQDIETKVFNVSSVTQLYNLMVRYNKQYCDETVLKELERLSKSTEAKGNLLNMKEYCRLFAKTPKTRGVQRRDLKSSGRIGSEAQQIQALMKKSQRSNTGCKPKTTLVEFPPSAESVYIPRCTNVKRCSGCCPNKIHTCRPIRNKIQTVKRKVVDIRVSTKDYKPVMKIKVMEVEQHKQCECVCPVLKLQCLPHQEYDEQNCSCRCKNRQEVKPCSHPKTWNSTSCRCDCSVSSSCSFGHFRDPESCKCVRTLLINNITTKLKKRNRNFDYPK